MELMAVIEGLKALKKGGPVTIHTDSRYVMDGASKWLSGWKIKGWKTADKKTGQERRPVADAGNGNGPPHHPLDLGRRAIPVIRRMKERTS